MWAVFNASFIPMIYFLFPETKGLHLEQIDHIFEEGAHGLGNLTQGVRESYKNPPKVDLEGHHVSSGDREEKASQGSMHPVVSHRSGEVGASSPEASGVPSSDENLGRR